MLKWLVIMSGGDDGDCRGRSKAGGIDIDAWGTLRIVFPILWSPLPNLQDRYLQFDQVCSENFNSAYREPWLATSTMVNNAKKKLYCQCWKGLGSLYHCGHGVSIIVICQQTARQIMAPREPLAENNPSEIRSKNKHYSTLNRGIQPHANPNPFFEVDFITSLTVKEHQRKRKAEILAMHGRAGKGPRYSC